MNETTLFLAQIMGPTFVIMGLSFIVQKDFFNKAYKDIFKPNLSYILMLLLMLPVGTLLVTKHFLWGSLAEGIISIVGLSILIKGVMLALVPNTFKSLTNSAIEFGMLTFGGIIWLIGGAYLTWVGFFA